MRVIYLPSFSEGVIWYFKNRVHQVVANVIYVVGFSFSIDRVGRFNWCQISVVYSRTFCVETYKELFRFLEYWTNYRLETASFVIRYVSVPRSRQISRLPRDVSRTISPAPLSRRHGRSRQKPRREINCPGRGRLGPAAERPPFDVRLTNRRDRRTNSH